MKPVFKVDGVSYNVIVPEGGLKRQGRVLDGESVGRMLSGRMMRDIVGTYYNYAMQIDTRNLDVAQYDALYQVLSAPVDYHTVILPYGQSTLTFQAYVTNLDDELVLIQEGRNLWGNLAFTFVAMQPERT